jgi:hypothetical protein
VIWVQGPGGLRYWGQSLDFENGPKLSKLMSLITSGKALMDNIETHNDLYAYTVIAYLHIHDVHPTLKDQQQAE